MAPPFSNCWHPKAFSPTLCYSTHLVQPQYRTCSFTKAGEWKAYTIPYTTHPSRIWWPCLCVKRKWQLHPGRPKGTDQGGCLDSAPGVYSHTVWSQTSDFSVQPLRSYQLLCVSIIPAINKENDTYDSRFFLRTGQINPCEALTILSGNRFL